MPGPFSRSANDEPAYTPVAPNPDPKKCHIEWAYTNGVCTLVMVHYEGCTNFEGKKILLYNASLKKIETEKFHFGLDPHFSKGFRLHPIARFEPTDRGKQMGIMMCQALDNSVPYRWA